MNEMEYRRLKADKNWLRQYGTSNSWFNKFNKTKSTYEEFRAPAHDYNPKVRVNQPLTILQLAPAFMALGFGIAVSSFIGVGGEFCSHGGMERIRRDILQIPRMIKQFIFWAIIEFVPVKKYS